MVKDNVKVHVAIDLESIVEADGVTMPKPQAATDSMFTGYSVARFLQEIALVLGRKRLAGS